MILRYSLTSSDRLIADDNRHWRGRVSFFGGRPIEPRIPCGSRCLHCCGFRRLEVFPWGSGCGRQPTKPQRGEATTGRAYGSANTNTLAALPGFSSGATRREELATSEGPVVTATYCLPPAANVTG